jgi:hypothetical protein
MRRVDSAPAVDRDEWTGEEFDSEAATCPLEPEASDEATVEASLGERDAAADLDEEDLDGWDDYDEGDEDDDEAEMALIDHLGLDWDAPSTRPRLDLASILDGEDSVEDDVAA